MTSGSGSPRATCPSRRLPSEAGLPDLQFLIDELTSGDDARAELASRRLAEPDNSALPLLSQLLLLGEVDQRWWAVRTLARLRSPDAAQPLTLALGDEASEVRQAAAVALRGTTDAAVLAALAAGLGDPDSLVARLAGDALAEAGGPAVPLLAQAVRDSRPRVRIEAARALAHISDPSVIPVLYALLDDRSSLVLHWAEHGLEAQGQNMVFFRP